MMAAKVFPFPVQKQQTVEGINQLIRAYLGEMTTDTELVNYVSERMKDFVETYASRTFNPNFDLALPPGTSPQQVQALLESIDQGFQNIAGQIHEMITKLIFERLYLEVEIYKRLERNKLSASDFDKYHKDAVLKGLYKPSLPPNKAENPD